MRVAVFAVPAADVPALPPELARLALLRAGRHALVGAAWVEYGPGGVLEYLELLVAVATRDRWRPRVTITDIWVDSVASRDGGRELWGIPKDLGRFTITDNEAAATTSRDTDAALASASLSARLRLPGRWPVRFRVTQALHGAAKTTPVRATARLGLGRSRWSVPAGSPLSWLRGRRPLLTAELGEFRMTFGEAQASTTGSSPTSS
jgi:hypothetical protein